MCCFASKISSSRGGGAILRRVWFAGVGRTIIVGNLRGRGQNLRALYKGPGTPSFCLPQERKAVESFDVHVLAADIKLAFKFSCQMLKVTIKNLLLMFGNHVGWLRTRCLRCLEAI